MFSLFVDVGYKAYIRLLHFITKCSCYLVRILTENSLFLGGNFRASNQVIFFWTRVQRISGPKLTGPGPSPGPDT